MRRHWFFILLSLAERDRHGSGVMRDVLELTDGELKLWPVTLYGSLDELRDQGWIRALESPPAGAEDDSARLRWFRITPAGRRALAAEVGRLQATLRVASRRLAHSGDTP
jgi:DNA-binding PadR family transcriptional regulator